jgi:hypothetical protein
VTLSQYLQPGEVEDQSNVANDVVFPLWEEGELCWLCFGAFCLHWKRAEMTCLVRGLGRLLFVSLAPTPVKFLPPGSKPMCSPSVVWETPCLLSTQEYSHGRRFEHGIDKATTRKRSGTTDVSRFE